MSDTHKARRDGRLLPPPDWTPKPGDAVRWFPRPRRATCPTVYGFALEVKGDKVLMEANGEHFHVPRSQLRPGRACQWCRRAINARNGRKAKFCCRDCWLDWKAAHYEQRTLDAIVAYKMAHDGNSPSDQAIRELSGLSDGAITRAIRRLVEYDRIELEWFGRNTRHIHVAGGRWTWEGKE